MKEYSQFPPYKYFIRVLKNCPKSSLLYIQLWKKNVLWKKEGHDTSLQIIKKEIRKEFLFSQTLFRNFLIPLIYLGLVSFKENDIQYEIDILGNNGNE